MKRVSPLLATLALATLTFGLTGQGAAQTTANAEIAKQLAPTGKLRVAVLMLSYFANEDGRELKGWSPELVIGLRTTFLVPAASPIRSISEADQPGVRIVVPARSAQGEHLDKIITKATLIRVPVETPQPAVDMLVAGRADVFSHVVPMLARAQAGLPGSRILPGSYYNVPIAIGYPKGQSAAVVEFCREFIADVKASGFVQMAIDRMGSNADGVVVLTP